MSDVRLTTIENASSGFNNGAQQQLRQHERIHAQKAQQALTGQRRQEEGAWNTYLFLLGAHKRTGESRLSAVLDAASALLAGEPATDTDNMRTLHTTTTTNRTTTTLVTTTSSRRRTTTNLESRKYSRIKNSSSVVDGVLEVAA